MGCYQNQYVDTKHKIIKSQVLPALKSESKELFENKEDVNSDPVTKHTYETIEECYEYENSQPMSVIFTKEKVKMKSNKKFVDNSGYLFYNVTTLDPSSHNNIIVDINQEFGDKEVYFHSF